MKDTDLKKAMHEHIGKQSLSDKQLDDLMRMQQIVSGKEKPFIPFSYGWIASIALVFMLVVGSFYFEIIPGRDLEQRIGAEVAKNHIKLKPLEIQTSSIQAIRSYFTELDFLPIESSRIGSGSKKLIGGRYCSIQGVTAAQLRLQDENTGKVQSLYQTNYDPKVFSGLPHLEEGQVPVTVYTKGIGVDIWVEKGLLFALTREADD